MSQGADILDTIKKRRSVRKYSKELPTDADIERILEAGRWAPSGLNNQPWRFLIVKDKTAIEGLSRFTKYGDVLRAAAVVIGVFMDLKSSYNRDKDLMAIGACIQNMCLQAYSMGLGTCWLGEILNRKEEVRKYLHLDEGLELMAVVTLGYPNEKITKGSRKPLKELMVS
jgi:nitroreductase